MHPDQFTQDDRVQTILAGLAPQWADPATRPAVSDIIDDDGHQYVDLVMEGGGVLGVALVGYTWLLESVGIRFLGLGGTSAGAINALVLAAVARPQEFRSERTLDVLANVDMYSFVDGDSDARDFVEALVDGAGRLRLIWKGAQIIDNIFNDHGLNPGHVFEDWLHGVLADNNADTAAKLDAKQRDTPASLCTRAGVPVSVADDPHRLAIISAEVTTETKVVFPQMAPLFWDAPGDVSPARFVRASMSIPGFFVPYRVTALPGGPQAVAQWDQLARYSGVLPTEAVFVDGGIMSNFPINLFHEPGVPRAPTFGVKLGTDRSKPHDVSSALDLASAIFDASRHTADFDFILRNPDYKQLVSHIETGKHNWLDFGISDAGKIDLFVRGARCAADFLRRFDWDAYKKAR